MLSAHQEAQRFERRGWADGYHDFDLIFSRPDGQPEDPDVVSHRFAAAVRRLGLRRVRFHDLRHTHATLLLEAGVDARTVSERLGHDSVATTLSLYAHVTPRLRLDAAAKMAALVNVGRELRAVSGSPWDGRGTGAR